MQACDECTGLFNLREQMFKLLMDSASLNVPSVFIAIRIVRLEISRALALHESKCTTAALIGKKIPHDVAQYLIFNGEKND